MLKELIKKIKSRFFYYRLYFFYPEGNKPMDPYPTGIDDPLNQLNSDGTRKQYFQQDFNSNIFRAIKTPNGCEIVEDIC